MNKAVMKTMEVLVGVGALNWGLDTLNSQWNLVALLGSLTKMNWLATAVYYAVGISGAYYLYALFVKK